MKDRNPVSIGLVLIGNRPTVTGAVIRKLLSEAQRDPAPPAVLVVVSAVRCVSGMSGSPYPR